MTHCSIKGLRSFRSNIPYAVRNELRTRGDHIRDDGCAAAVRAALRWRVAMAMDPKHHWDAVYRSM
jgi:hypothetical protein